jgi:hypothetical protein
MAVTGINVFVGIQHDDDCVPLLKKGPDEST